MKQKLASSFAKISRPKLGLGMTSPTPPIGKMVTVGEGGYIENGTYPIKIYTLGRFWILKDDKPVSFSGKVQKKPLELLKAIIAFGGINVGDDQLIDALWPEAAGDVAYVSFKTTLHRLRHLIGYKEAIQHGDGHITIDSRYCYVDVRAFECLIGEAEEKQKAGSNDIAVQLIEKAVKLYTGPFLAGEAEEPWMIPIRERLRSRFSRSVVRLCHYWQQAKECEKALGCCLRGIEEDELTEEFYQCLIVCYHRLGLRADALSVYERCKKTLNALLGVEPSPETEAIKFEVLKS